jgi:hypothetical protein
MVNPSRHAPGFSWTSLPRHVLLAAALLFCAGTTLNTVIWMYNVRSPVLVEFGFNKTQTEEYDLVTHSVLVHDLAALRRRPD